MPTHSRKFSACHCCCGCCGCHQRARAYIHRNVYTYTHVLTTFLHLHALCPRISSTVLPHAILGVSGNRHACSDVRHRKRRLRGPSCMWQHEPQRQHVPVDLGLVELIDDLVDIIHQDIDARVRAGSEASRDACVSGSNVRASHVQETTTENKDRGPRCCDPTTDTIHGPKDRFCSAWTECNMKELFVGSSAT